MVSWEKNHTCKSTDDLHGFCFLFMLIAIHKFVPKPSHHKGSVNKPNTITERIEMPTSIFITVCILQTVPLDNDLPYLKINVQNLSFSGLSFLKDK